MRAFNLPQVIQDPLLTMAGIGPRLRRVDFQPRPRPGSGEGVVSRPVVDFQPRPRITVGEGRARTYPFLAPRDRRWATMGLSDEAPGFWSSLSSTVGDALKAVVPSLAAVQVAKLQIQGQQSILKSQAQLYTPQNVQTLQAQGFYEATHRANAAAAASGSTMAPMSTGTMIAVGALALGGIWLATSGRK